MWGERAEHFVPRPGRVFDPSDFVSPRLLYYRKTRRSLRQFRRGKKGIHFLLATCGACHNDENSMACRLRDPLSHRRHAVVRRRRIPRYSVRVGDADPDCNCRILQDTWVRHCTLRAGVPVGARLEHLRPCGRTPRTPSQYGGDDRDAGILGVSVYIGGGGWVVEVRVRERGRVHICR